MPRLLIVLCFLIAPAVLAQQQSAEAIQKALNSESTVIASWGMDKVFLEAVRAQNAKKVKFADIEAIDKQWMAGKADDVVKRVITGQCADHLRQLVSQHPGFGEAFVMDDQGALVCANARTSDYWQGDESKWQRSFNGGKGAVFIDRPRYDESAQMPLAQLSVPVMDGRKAIGAITVGMNVYRLKGH